MWIVGPFQQGDRGIDRSGRVRRRNDFEKAMTAPAAPRKKFNHALVFLAFVIPAIITQFWVIDRLAGWAPDNDQWHIDILQIDVPMAHHQFDWHVIFQSWQEHHIILQKLVDVAYFAVLRRFDQVLECRVQAVVFCTAGAGMITLLLSRLKWRWASGVFLGLAFALPFGYTNFIYADSFQHLLNLLFLFTACWQFANGRVVRGALITTLAMTNYASGFMPALAFGALAFTDGLQKRLEPKRAVLILALALCLGGIGFLMRERAPQQEWHRAHDASQAFVTVMRYLSWPSYFSPWTVALNLAPVTALLVQRLRGRTRASPEEGLALLLFLCALADSLVIGIFRANNNNIFIPRFQVSFIPLLVANVIAFNKLWQPAPARPDPKRPQPGAILAALAGAWSWAAVNGMISITTYAAIVSMSYSELNRQNTAAGTLWNYANRQSPAIMSPPQGGRIALSLDEQHVMPELPDLLNDPEITNVMPELRQ
jgi:hypothetical protein